jgi:hypothetical protein
VNVPLQELAGFPERVRELIEDLSHDQLTTKRTPEEFSFAEHVCHLRDIEREGYLVRIGLIQKFDCPSLPDIDGTRLAIERDYNSEDVADAIYRFSLARNESIKLLQESSEEQWYRKGALEGVGETTLLQLVEMMLEHDASHFEEMTSLKRSFVRTASTS